MTLFVAWVVYPLVIAALSLGCGLLLQRVGGRPLPGPLLVPAGFAVIVVAASFTTMSGATARLTTPLVVALAVAGFTLSRRLRPRVDGWAAAAAVAVFGVYAAPIVLSGSATFAGYITLDDTATWLALVDNAMTHGRDHLGLAPSSYSVVLNDYLGTGYPLGAFLPLGIGQELTRQDVAWLFQPQIAFLAGLLALSIYELTAELIRRRPLRALVAFLGSQPALLYGYAYWSGIKEVTVAASLSLVSALAVVSFAKPWHARSTVPLAVGTAAVLSVLSVAGAVWFVSFAVFVGLLVMAHGLARAWRSLVVLVGLGLILSIPALATARTFVHVTNAGDITSGNSLGNLIHPLSKLQVFGVWPIADFRLRPSDIDVSFVLIAALAIAAAIGLLAAVRTRCWGVPLYVVVAIGGSFFVIAVHELGNGSPWLDAKALATASPALLVAGVAGVSWMFESGRVVEAVVALAAIATGVLWSNALAYGNVWLAPHAQLAELETIGKRFAGDGPTLMTEYQPYGVRHFLRNLEPEGASERRARPVYLRNGGTLDRAQYADLDDFQLADVLTYRTIVLRTSPVESRPPSVYRLVSRGRYYEVWQRPERPRPVLEHLSLGDEQQPVAVPACGEVRRLAGVAAQNGGTLAASIRDVAQIVDLSQGGYPSAWQPSSDTLVPHGAGTLTEMFAVSTAASYGFWLGGSFRDGVSLSVDGRRVGSARDQLNEPAQLTPLGAALLSAGRHDLELQYGGIGLRPGSRGAQFALGPMVMGTPAAEARLVNVPPAKAMSLCDKRLDWIEALGP